jgi:hypothetical protein
MGNRRIIREKYPLPLSHPIAASISLGFLIRILRNRKLFMIQRAFQSMGMQLIGKILSSQDA